MTPEQFANHEEWDNQDWDATDKKSKKKKKKENVSIAIYILVQNF